MFFLCPACQAAGGLKPIADTYRSTLPQVDALPATLCLGPMSREALMLVLLLSWHQSNCSGCIVPFRWDIWLEQTVCMCSQRSKAAAIECSKVAVAVACGDGDVPVQLTSSELQKFTVPRMANVWKVRTPSSPLAFMLHVCATLYSVHAR